MLFHSQWAHPLFKEKGRKEEVERVEDYG